MSIKKEFQKDQPVCKVKFTLPGDAVKTAKTINLVGDFNNWDTSALPMKKTKDGSCAAVLALETGKEYQFRYLIDGTKWENDWNADKYVPSAIGHAENSVVVL